MCPNILTDVKFLLLLFKYDQDLAESLHESRCPNCGGKLDWGNYPRKPRGGPRGLEEKYKIRFSLCCRNEGCRKRVRPRSLRFLGRRVYFSMTFSLLTALSQGASSKKICQLKKDLGINERTFLRWKKWWKEVFPISRFWQREKSILIPQDKNSKYPSALLALFRRLHDWPTSFYNYLIFISPIDAVNDV